MSVYRAVPALSRIPWLFHGFGTRYFSENDLRDMAAENGAKPVLLRQIHSARVLVLRKAPAELPEADATATNRPGLALVVKTADCLPLFLVDPDHRAVAAVHAGWRGSARRIVGEAVAALGRAFGTHPASLLAALGPCIGGSCYEVGEDVVASFPDDGPSGSSFRPVAGRPGKYLLDLPEANRAQLETAGVLAANIHDSGTCTHCDPALLSFRRDRRSDLRLFNFIGIRAD